jgi:ABC-2 type transport system ATP-binding protein
VEPFVAAAAHVAFGASPFRSVDLGKSRTMMRDSAALDTAFAVRAERLSKRYSDTLAVDALSLEIPSGQFFGLLGPNGSGKTTTIHMLSTLIRPSSGSVYVGGYDVVSQPVRVRSAIGVVFQEAALDRTLSVAENLRFAGMLGKLSADEIEKRSNELLNLFGLADKRDKLVSTLSGGMRRALDIARGVIHHPSILFLDEPTIGLDVPNRRKIWSFIARLRAQTGMTVFLTTHYLEEAVDCDRVAFIKKGRIVKSGPPRDLIRSLGEYVLEVEADDLDELCKELKPRLGACLRDAEHATFLFHGDSGELAKLQSGLGDRIAALRWRKPNLNDVFLWVNEGK